MRCKICGGTVRSTGPQGIRKHGTVCDNCGAKNSEIVYTEENNEEDNQKKKSSKRI